MQSSLAHLKVREIYRGRFLHINHSDIIWRCALCIRRANAIYMNCIIQDHKGFLWFALLNLIHKETTRYYGLTH